MRTNSIVGIDDMALYVPKLYFSIASLAEIRNLPYAKLNKGLGLKHMAIADMHEDAATMAANAVAQLIEKNNLNPHNIGRIYMGTESAMDGAKPMATYTLEMLQQKYAKQYGDNCFLHCDVVDLTFACVGGVDALQNTIDWVSGSPERIGIVVASDDARYELASGGEYTQGAGAVAMLVTHDPRLIAINNTWGVACKGEHDFFKPVRTFTKEQIIEDVLNLGNASKQDLVQYINSLAQLNGDAKGIFAHKESKLSLFKKTPVFDGQFSNQCYQDRITEAFKHFCEQAINKGQYQPEDTPAITHAWERLIFHLPYAFHAKRIFSAIYVEELKKAGEWAAFAAKYELLEPQKVNFETINLYEKSKAQFLRAVTKTDDYRTYVQQKIEKGQRASSLVGNMYAASIFLSLMSQLEVDLHENNEMEGKKIGFFGYGSGSKSKVFEGVIQPAWKEVVSQFGIFTMLDKRTEIDYEQYYQIHTETLPQSLSKPSNEFALTEIGTEGVTEGARYYAWI